MGNYIDNLLPAPNLLYPLGGESFTEKIVVIRWSSPNSDFLSNEFYWYELYVSEDVTEDYPKGWIQIGSVPYGENSFNWKINYYLKGKRCRIGINLVDYKGYRSEMSLSPSFFVITDRKLPIPSVYKPIENGKYSSSLPIIFDQSGLLGQCSRKAFYKISYASEKLLIDWTPLMTRVSIDSDPIFLDITGFLASSDYSFKFELTDGEQSSEPVFVNNVIVNSSDSFKIDTVPPTGTVQVVNNKEYIKDRGIILRITAYDETTGVKSFKILQKGLNEGEADIVGASLPMTDLVTWTVEGGDGAKLIQSIFEDYGGNKIESSSSQVYFRTYKGLNNVAVTSLLVVNNGAVYDLWSAFGGESPQLYFNRNQETTLGGEATSLIVYNGVLYIGIVSDEREGVLQRYNQISSEITTIYEFSSLDSIINSMVIFDDKIFIGLQSGELYSFDGISLTKEYNNTNFNNPICCLGTNINSLFIFMDNSEEIYSMQKNNLGQYEYTIL